MSLEYSGKLEYVGFKPHRPGRIHIYCPECGRRYSNAPRQPDDPPKAVLMHLKCEDCGMGDKEGITTYLDAQGEEVSPWAACDECGDTRFWGEPPCACLVDEIEATR